MGYIVGVLSSLVLACDVLPVDSVLEPTRPHVVFCVASFDVTALCLACSCWNLSFHWLVQKQIKFKGLIN